MQGNEAAVGFYWTMPVPWAGFTDVPKHVDAAATVSLTIRYQRDLIRRYAKSHRMDLIHEAAFVEVAPDRGTEQLPKTMCKVETICQDNRATLLLVDFAQVQGWRSHMKLQEWSRKTRIEVRSIYPDSILIDGKTFDPHGHFEEWRQRQQAWTEGKSAHAVACQTEANRLRATGLSYAAIALKLNASGIPNLTGKAWTGDNLRKFLAKMPTD